MPALNGRVGFDAGLFFSRFSTICAKNQVLKLKIDKVTVIRVTKCPLLARLPCMVAWPK